MIKHFPADAAERAALRSNALFVLGYSEKSKKWLLVTEEIRKIQAGQAALQDSGSHIIDAMAPERNDSTPLPSCWPTSHLPPKWGTPEDMVRIRSMGKGSESRIPILIALVAWSELMWILLLRVNG
jgi:hypothetical protein